MATLAPNDFTHLHVHSEFSLLDGLGRITDLVDSAAAHGFDSLAITDHGALYGAVAFYQAAKAKGIKPIIGVETYVARRSMTEKEGKADAQPFHLILLAKDYTGYRNLCRLVTDAHVDGYYYKPRIDREHLARYSEGLVGLSACLGGEIPRALEIEDWDSARRIAKEYEDILGKGNFFLELQDHGMAEQRVLNEKLLRLAPETGLPLVVTNDLHYVHEGQSDAQDVLLCIGTGNNLDTPDRMKFEGRDFWLKPASAMAALFPDQREAILNTRRIAEMTDLELPLGQLRIPHFPVPDGETVETWLRKECEKGLRERYGTVTPELQARLDYELGVIITMGYAGYFLIVADFVRFAREQRIQTTCRGSAPGSIVTYTLGITPVDPIAYGLPFERFLNPDRVTMPDIDVDFEDERRDEVINYVSRKYGSDHVAQIITFGTMLARAAIRDVGRVLGHSYGEVDRIAKAVPNQLGIKLDEALQISPDLKGQVDADPAVKRIIDFARQLEGVARNASTHAAGVVISREPLTELMPLQKATNSDALMTQYEMHGIEALGLLKFDFLGLSNLTILRHAVDLVKQERGEAIDLDRIPLDDAKTFELLASGETTGIFQLESAGMRRYIRELKPTSVYDLAAMVALFRPGPMDNIPAYIRRKHGQEPVTYLHPLLEPYLEKTYGIFVYQEDIMAAAIALGGFTGPEADTLGYAIRKKKSAVLRAQKEKFVTQAAERGVRPDVIDAVFKAFEPFERYGFNKAHATCYGLIAYQTAYLKANYTVEYMTAVLTAFRANEEKVAAAIAECRRMGIEVLPPNVHRSGVEFTVEGPAIRFGLLAVKNVGQGAIESIVAARDEGGPFKSLTDLCSRVDLRLVNRKVLEALAKVGALNDLGHPAQILLGLDDAIAAGQSAQRDRITGQTSLFDLAMDDLTVLERPLPAATEVPVRERLRWEKELLGLYLSEHPMGEVAEQVGAFVTAYSGDLKDESLDGQRVVVGAIVTGFRTVITKTQSTMGVATVEDLQGSIEVVVFPKMYEQTAGTWADGAILLIAGRVDHRGEEVSLLADLVMDWDAAVARGPEAFAREVAAGDRGRGRRFGGPNGNGSNGHGPNGNGANGNGWSRSPSPQPPVPVMAAAGPAPEPVPVASGVGVPPRDEIRPGVPRVSPLRADAATAPAPVPSGELPRIAPAVPITTYDEPAGLHGAEDDRAAGDDEPALPDEARSRVAVAAGAPTPQVESAPDQVLHVRFGGASSDRLVLAMETFRALLRERPGGTRVVLHVPAPNGGATLPMELSRRVAYDAELLSEVRRRLGEGLVDLSLGWSAAGGVHGRFGTLSGVTELVGAVLTRPSIEVEAAAAVLRASWGVEGELRPLPSERDRNFAVRVDGADAYVLKVSNRAEDPAFLEMQHGALAILGAAGVPCQRAVEATDGTTIVRWVPTTGDAPLLVRLLTWLPGTPLAAVPTEERSDELLEDLGATMGRAARALAHYDHPAARRAFQWDARRGLGVIDTHAAAVASPGRAALLAHWRDRLLRLRDVLPTLRESVIHNDANDHNVLVADDRTHVSGLLDLGDAIWSVTVNELAVAAAYAALGARDPLGVITAVRAGFERELPLTIDEGGVVVDLVALRLCTSVALSAHQSRLAPDDPYLTISEAPAWELLARLAAEMQA